MKNFLCDQSDKIKLNNFLSNNKLENDLDLVIDDGKHDDICVLNSFDILFKNLKSLAAESYLSVCTSVCALTAPPGLLSSNIYWWSGGHAKQAFRPMLSARTRGFRRGFRRVLRKRRCAQSSFSQRNLLKTSRAPNGFQRVPTSGIDWKPAFRPMLSAKARRFRSGSGGFRENADVCNLVFPAGMG